MSTERQEVVIANDEILPKCKKITIQRLNSQINGLALIRLSCTECNRFYGYKRYFSNDTFDSAYTIAVFNNNEIESKITIELCDHPVRLWIQKNRALYKYEKLYVVAEIE